jgi:hypothetical protein
MLWMNGDDEGSSLVAAK